MATVVRVLNNNLVLCTDDCNRQVIFTGRGIGFRRKLGDEISPDEATQTFVPSADQALSTLVSQLADIPTELLAAVDHAVAHCPSLGSMSPQARQALVVAMADHLDGAFDRHDAGATVTYPLYWEVQQLFPKERTIAENIVHAVEKELGRTIAPEEVTPLAMHLINAQFMTADMDAVAKMTQKIRQVLDLVCLALDIDPADHEVDVARFVAHLRYLFVRVHDGKTVCGPKVGLLPVLQEQAPRAVKIARQVATALAMSGPDIGDDEIAYLALHISRLDAAQ